MANLGGQVASIQCDSASHVDRMASTNQIDEYCERAQTSQSAVSSAQGPSRHFAMIQNSAELLHQLTKENTSTGNVEEGTVDNLAESCNSPGSQCSLPNERKLSSSELNTCDIECEATTPPVPALEDGSFSSNENTCSLNPTGADKADVKSNIHDKPIREIPATLAPVDALETYTQISSHPFHKTDKQGIISLDILHSKDLIATGTAKGLAFLHHGFIPHIIHRDVKASNILLNEDFEPKVADFGLARLISACETHISTDIAGTFGYIPPKYGQSGRSTTRGDVYSFGVILLELVTGKEPTGSNFKEIEGGNLEDRLDTMVQPRLTDALSNRKVDAAQDLRGILIRIGRFKSLESQYSKDEMERTSSVGNFQSVSSTISFSNWLPSFYDELLLYLEQEWQWCMVSFPEDYKALGPRLKSSMTSP
ncbi:hypothetical protein KIW84_075288 [Lathyrus oleraceus]|uniref:Protein kinase domain-containing protein n=1 Tax=Pisum sativum TaxID=3888 RepID=A0A9D4VWB5_PEA|nr:hypothetical protein KIW84_075288 [Pisum sativum]